MIDHEHEMPTPDLGPYDGDVAVRYRDPVLLDALRRLPEFLSGPRVRVLGFGRNRHIRTRLPCGNETLDVFVKQFGQQNAIKDVLDYRLGSKASRTWRAADHLRRHDVGTPTPVAYLDRWRNRRLTESYYVSLFRPAVVSFKDELIRLFREEPECERFMLLLQTVADAVRNMHEGGLLHRDLGNQNILLERDIAGRWHSVQFVDLNRARILPGLSWRQRARDVSRIALPSDLLRVFREMYTREVPPETFLSWEARYRRLYAWHTLTRRFRHPVRNVRRRTAASAGETYPDVKDMWIWDERSAQAIGVLVSRDRHRHYPRGQVFCIASNTMAALPRVWREYRARLAGAFTEPVAMCNRVGIALDPRPGNVDRLLACLRELGRLPVLVRVYHHESVSRRDLRTRFAQRLHNEGIPFSIALVQDRRAVRDPTSWKRFASVVLERVGADAEFVELGHAINRVKWGIWNLGDFEALMAPFGELAKRFPSVTFAGPAGIDFEYPFALSALRRLPRGLHLGAFSHHLYVDRRGAPENRQGPFSAVEKFALGRAIAATSEPCDDRFIVSEVNWPILDTGVYSPVNSPYESPGERVGNPGVDEATYADYMVRYILLAACSGLVDRVVWWRLVARGFGLVDDSDSRNWRKRDAFRVLQFFLATVGSSTFAGRTTVPAPTQEGGRPSSVDMYAFERKEGEIRVVVSPRAPVLFNPSFAFTRAADACGNELRAQGRHLPVGGRPVYFFVAS